METSKVTDDDFMTNSDRDFEIEQRINNFNDSSENSSLSKRKQKRLAKHQKWLANRGAKRLKQRESRKQKLLLAKEKGLSLGPSRKRLKASTMANSVCKISVVIDMSFDSFMEDQDLCKCVKQLQRCYSLNRRSIAPMQFYITNLNDKAREKMSQTAGSLKWDVYYKKENYLDLFNKEQIIYLTSESPNIINTLEESKIYIIGGLVDHNKYKGKCFNIAQEKGIQHGQLPLDDYLDMKTRKVLTIDQVFEILLRYTECKNWQEAFMKSIPQRKGAQPKCDEKTKDNTQLDLNVEDKLEYESSNDSKKMFNDILTDQQSEKCFKNSNKS